MVTQRLDALAERNRNLISEIESQLSKRSSRKNGLTAHVYGRRKQPFSIWTKMERKSVGFEQLSDIFGFRIVMIDLESCYVALGVVHTADLAGGTRPLQGLHLDAEAKRLSIDPHHRCRPRQPARRIADPHRRDGPDRPELGASPAHAFYKEGMGSPTELLKREIQRLRPLAAPHGGDLVGKRQSGGNSSSTPSSRNCSTTRCSASRPRAS